MIHSINRFLTFIIGLHRCIAAKTTFFAENQKPRPLQTQIFAKNDQPCPPHLIDEKTDHCKHSKHHKHPNIQASIDSKYR